MKRKYFFFLSIALVTVFLALPELAVAHGRNARIIQEKNSREGVGTASKNENHILEQARNLKKDNKTEEALAVLYKGMDQFPASAQILNEALQIYLEEKRNDERKDQNEKTSSH